MKRKKEVEIIYSGMPDVVRSKPFQSGGSVKGKEVGLKTWQLAAALLGFRVVNAILCYSSFVPDEYWQALEVAHKMVFGYGHLTWEWHYPIRGFTHPSMYAALYKALALLRLDYHYPILLIVLPRLLHAPIAVLGDIYVMKLASQIFNKRAGKYALWANVASWFTFYCITRTLSNSIEACLTPVILYYWVLACDTWDLKRKSRYSHLYLLLMGVSVLVRPTGAIMWPPIVLAQFYIDRRHFFLVLRAVIVMGILTLGWSVCVDYLFYGEWVVVQWNFVKFNVLDGHSALYGSNSWHWYFTEDVPVLLFTSLPLVILGAWLVPGGWWGRGPLLLAVWELVVHSCLSHKEHRYVLPIVPIASIYAGYAILWLLVRYTSKVVHWLLYGLLLANVPIALYFSLIHQSGSISVMSHLRNDIADNSSVLFLMPCHTTPLFSHIHRPVDLKFLECPPPIRPDYLDVSKEFYANPEEWLQKLAVNYTPSHLVLFDVLHPKIEKFLQTHNYELDARLFHTHFPESERYGTQILVFKKSFKKLEASIDYTSAITEGIMNFFKEMVSFEAVESVD